jgi:hypothetical protein
MTRDEAIRQALLELQPKMATEGGVAEDEIVTCAAELGHAGVTSAEIQAVLDRAAEQRLQNAAQRRRQAIEWLLFTDGWFANEVAYTRDLNSNQKPEDEEDEEDRTITLIVLARDVEIIRKNLRSLASALMEGSV